MQTSSANLKTSQPEAILHSFSSETLPELALVEMVLAEKSLREYSKQAWRIVEPKKRLIWNWHHDAICEHLEAVSLGQINYLLINIPPRHTKSLLAGVFWPTWEWGPFGKPETRYITSSYADQLSTRDALKSRRIIQSPWYQRCWGDRFKITSDQNMKTRYENNHYGYRIATSVDGLGTGEGGDRIIVDDPHNVKQAESDLKRNACQRWWDETMSTRIDDEDTGAFIIIAQRTHWDDLCGHIIKKAETGEIDNLVKLIIPARFEKKRDPLISTNTPLPFKDPRTKEGEPIDKERFPEKKLKKREMRMTEHSRAGQMQQRPTPRGGGIFKVDNFVMVSEPTLSQKVVRAVRYWDKAGTEDGGKRTAGVLMCLLKSGRVQIQHCRKGQWSSAKREAIIKQQAELDDRRFHHINVKTYVEQEPGSGGKESAENTVRNLSGFVVYADRATGDKIIRSEPYQAAVENEMVELVTEDWTQEFIDEHEKAPAGEFQDQWDSASGAYNKLFEHKKSAGVWGS